MPFDETYFKRFKLAVGDNNIPPIFESTEVEDFFTQAAEEYPDGSANAHLAYAVLLGLNALWANAVRQVSYTANASSESLSDMALRYERMIGIWEKRLDTALTTNEVAIMWGSTHKTPLRDEEYPDA